MRILVLGGTVFVSHAIATEAVRRGHEVSCAARGASGTVPAGAELVPLDRDEPGAIERLAGARFDAVIDVATHDLDWVRDALRALAETTGHWTFVSTINVYADTATQHQKTDGALLEPVTEPRRSAGGQLTPEIYGGIKVASENAVYEAVGERTLVVRPGLITGPGDNMDRFGYWPARFARGGRVVVPDAPEQPIQHLDVRDLAEWIVTAGERGITGTHDAVGPIRTLGSVLSEIAELAGTADVEPVPVAPEKLLEGGIVHWEGPRSLPLWAPSSHYGVVTHDPTPAAADGLVTRPLADTVRAALAEERARGLHRPRKSGLTPAVEAELLC
ncbi:Nucleoside-diphosphate-sugar epimerase [Actinopolyspora lacussalsi subsp. righensis]|uniref:Nucleoside-diphosphate-sugar epimerase n=1 Tax=Actinopolyspora righensis TaxID=995060 RepID=A0A1I6YUJ2_9ACTN|nr:NAD-dependent epimerase/dehydratase family protein [Actinopolyspora righensis]SFT54086.1 Nucleoside-diphosphate-sugar epimerase [Actinopolyspora righensis]